MKKLKDTVLAFAHGISQRKLTVFSASGCYYLFMSLVPIVMIVCCILPYTPFNQSMILGLIDKYFTEALAEIVRKIVSAVYSSSGTTLTISILLTLYSASASMKALMNGMDAAYNFENHQNYLIYCLRALIYMVILVATLVVSLVIMVYGHRILLLIKHFLPDVTLFDTLLSKGRYLVVMALLAVVFTLLYKLMPSQKVRVKDQIPGAVFSAVIWVLFSSAFSLYVEISDKYGAYGFIGTIMVAMMWMYYCFLFLLIGGYLNSWLTARKEAKK